MSDLSTLDVTLRQIKREDAIKFACDLVNIPSPAGHEKNVAEYIIQFFDSLGIQSTKQYISEERCNAIGLLEGTGGGLSLTFNGHMDTAFTGSKQDLIWMRKETAKLPEVLTKAQVRDESIYGVGVSNMKGGLAAMMTAAKALKESGVRLKGDVLFASVVGETSRAPVDEFVGQDYEGGGYGTRYLVARGITSDYAVCCDGSDMKLSWVQAGVAFFKITTYGTPLYVPYAERDWNRRQSASALAKMVPVINAVEDWAAEYEEKHKREFDGLLVTPKVCIGSIRSGLPARPSVTPGVCSIYVDVRTPPDLSPLEVKEQIEKVLEKTGIETDLQMYRSQMGYVAKGAEELITIAKKVHTHLFGKPIEKAEAQLNSMWTDSNVYTEIGIPCIKYGPSSAPTERKKVYEYVYIDDIVNAAKFYVAFALELCNRTKK